ncbi:MAG: hypothetical protein AAGL17_06725 [Cyanobacteria bacterium J06576_12]
MAATCPRGHIGAVGEHRRIEVNWVRCRIVNRNGRTVLLDQAFKEPDGHAGLF